MLIHLARTEVLGAAISRIMRTELLREARMEHDAGFLKEGVWVLSLTLIEVEE